MILNPGTNGGRIQPTYIVSKHKEEKEIDEACRWADAYGVPVVLFEEIERIRGIETNQKSNKKIDRKNVSDAVLNARNIYEELLKDIEEYKNVKDSEDVLRD